MFIKNHEKLEKNSIFLLIAIIIAISIGSIVEILPLFRIETTIGKIGGMRPYTPLELAGYNIYLREGCHTCHSQQIRPLRDEVERYGHYSIAAESMYDYPFQWGSKRTGPDLARIGGKYSDEWHKAHLINPRSVVPESIMPTYKFMQDREADIHNKSEDLRVLSLIGVPYTDEMIQSAYSDAVAQVSPDSDDAERLEKHYPNVKIRDFDGNHEIISELDALIAYLQVLGTMVTFVEEK